jgi:hypothetical protein
MQSHLQHSRFDGYPSCAKWLHYNLPVPPPCRPASTTPLLYTFLAFELENIQFCGTTNKIVEIPSLHQNNMPILDLPSLWMKFQYR